MINSEFMSRPICTSTGSVTATNPVSARGPTAAADSVNSAVQQDDDMVIRVNREMILSVFVSVTKLQAQGIFHL